MRGQIISGLAIVAGIYLLLCLLLFAGQRKLLYFPTPAVDVELAEPHWIDSENQRLKLWAVRRDTGRAVIYFGGNAENVANSIKDYTDWLPDYSIYLVNYRGYGGSSGNPTETGLFTDALKIHDELAGRYGSISVVGRSLGSGVAMYLAASRKLERLVLITPFDSVASVARNFYRIFPTDLLLLDRFDSLSRVKRVASPTLVLIADRDQVIPPRHAERLIAAFPPMQVRAERLPEANHGNVHLWPDFHHHIMEFLN